MGKVERGDGRTTNLWQNYDKIARTFSKIYSYLTSVTPFGFVPFEYWANNFSSAKWIRTNNADTKATKARKVDNRVDGSIVCSLYFRVMGTVESKCSVDSKLNPTAGLQWLRRKVNDSFSLLIFSSKKRINYSWKWFDVIGRTWESYLKRDMWQQHAVRDKTMRDLWRKLNISRNSK